MRTLLSTSVVMAGVLGFGSIPAVAQPGPDAGGSTVVSRMMVFDKDGDGKLTKAEVTDERLHPLFDDADASQDSTVTQEELTTFAATLAADAGPGFRRGGGRRGGPGGPDDFGPGGPGGPGGRGRGGPPQPGIVLPMPLRESLNLTAEQHVQLDALQKDVDERLSRILTDGQKVQLEEIRARGGRGGRGPRGGRGGPPPGPGF